MKLPLTGSDRHMVTEALLSNLAKKKISKQSDFEIEVMILFKKSSYTLAPANLIKKSFLSEDNIAENNSKITVNQSIANNLFEVIQLFAETYNLQISEWSIPKRRVKLKGKVSDMERAFEVKLTQIDSENGKPLFEYKGVISVHEELAPHIAAVLGLDSTPLDIYRTKIVQKLQSQKNQAEDTQQIAGKLGENPNWTPSNVELSEISKLYDFPSDLSGEGQVIGIIELGGGYAQSDLTSFFTQNNIPVPIITDVSINGATNTPGTSYDIEVTMDIEIAVSVAPSSKFVIYFAPINSMGFIQGVQDAINDSVNKPGILSISWGMTESSWTQNELNAFNEVLNDAANSGITVIASSGDQGFRNTYNFANVANVNYPASDPYVLSCGGTMIEIVDNTIIKEEVWNEGPFTCTGGGISNFFPVPDWQNTAKIPPSINPGNKSGRGVPDVSANAANYKLYIKGSATLGNGTSAVVPLWAGLIACFNQKIGKRLGFINPIIYNLSIDKNENIFYKVSSGTNGGYSASKPWNACSGLGRPYGNALLLALLNSDDKNGPSKEAYKPTNKM